MQKILDEIMHTGRVKVYPDGSALLTVSDRAIFREPGWELAAVWSETREKGASRARSKDEDKERAVRRARARLVDLARCNDFRYFVTLTLDAARVDRYDPSLTGKQLRRWLSNQVQRYGLIYALVPEHHRDGAIHFHGLINDALSLSDSGTVKPPEGGPPRRPASRAQRMTWLENGGSVVYNVPGWTLGFSTAIPLYGDYRAAVGYVCKYINKNTEKIGGRYLYAGGNLEKPSVDFVDVDYSDFASNDSAEYLIKRLGAKCKNIELKGAF